MRIHLRAPGATSEPCYLRKETIHSGHLPTGVIPLDGQQLAIESIIIHEGGDCEVNCYAPQSVLIMLMVTAVGWVDHSLNNYCGYDALPKSEVRDTVH